MSVQRQIVPVPIATGIDTNTDPKQLQAKLLICENGYVARQGVVQKRNGSAVATGSYTAPFLTVFRDRPVLIGMNYLGVYDGGSTLSGSFDPWLKVGASPTTFCDIGREHLSATAGDTYYQPDIAETEAVRAISYTAYRDVSGTMTFVPCIETYDKATGLLLDREESTAASSASYCRRFRLVEAGGTIVAVFAEHYPTNGEPEGDYISAIEINGTTGIIGSSSSSYGDWPCLTADAADENCFDACLIEGDGETTEDAVAIVYAADDGAGQQVVVGRYDPGTGFLAIPASLTASNPLTVGCSPWGLSTEASLTPGIFGVWFDQDVSTERHLMGCCMDASLTVIAGDATAPPPVPIKIATITDGYLVKNIPACQESSSNEYHHVTWTLEPAAKVTPAFYPEYWPDPEVWKATVVKDEVAGTLSVDVAAAKLRQKAKLFARPFGSTSVGVSAPYLPCQYQAEKQEGNEFYSQSAYYLLDSAGYVIGKSSVGRAGPWAELVHFISADHFSYVGGHYSNAVSYGYEHTFGALQLVRQVSDAGNYLNVPSLAEASYQMLTVTEGLPSSIRCLERGNLHIPNSNPYLWDGQTLVEDGFHQYPEGLAILTADDAAGFLVPTKTYLYYATYEWMDSNGFVHSSAPSPPLEVTIPACPTHGAAAALLSVPTLSLTRKTNVRIVLWRTKQDGQIAYRVTAVDNVPTDSVAQITDAGGTSAADDDLTGAPYLYTTGGRVENIQPQPFRAHAVHQDRHFIVDRERESTHVWYSKSAVNEDDNEERGFHANDRMLVQVPPDGGRIIALSSYLDRLVVFKETRIYVVTGNGVDDYRQGAGYSAAILLDPTIGCVNEKSVVQVPTGVMFLSERGIYQLDQSLQRVPVGLPVKEHTDSLTIVAANVIPEKGYVAFSTDGVALVFSYVYGTWSTFTEHAASDAAAWLGKLAWKGSLTDYAVHFENTSSFLDVTRHVSMRLRTGVLSFGGIFGFERIFSVGFIGQALAACMFRVKTAYDAAPYFLDDQTISGATALGKYFDCSAYLDAMSDSTYLDKTLMVDAGTSRQKVSGVMNEISDEQVPAVVTIVTVSNSTQYRVDVAPGTSSASQITYTSDSTATRAEIVNGLVSAINTWSDSNGDVVVASNVSDTLQIAANGTTPFTVSLAGGETKMTLANGSATDDGGYSLSVLAYEIGLLPGAWPSSVIGTARGM